MNKSRMIIAIAAALVPALSLAAPSAPKKLTPVLADVSILEEIGVKPLAIEPSTKVGYARLTDEQRARLTHVAHDHKKCGGYEALEEEATTASHFVVKNAFGQLAAREAKRRSFVPQQRMFQAVQANPKISTAVGQVSETNLKATVTFMSSFEDRFNRGSAPNKSVEALKARIEDTVKGAKLPVTIEFIGHKSTPQKSIRARIEGSTRPNEVVVLGGHLDSINQDWMGPKTAPGADDNASGSANLLEALRIVANQEQPQRSIEFFWYAGEESGLLGSAEIAKDYAAKKRDVIGVLQLDMTLFPGNGEFILGSMTDFTSAWMRSYFTQLNELYIKARIVEDKCGYGCSDHASWDRQGFPTLMPFEATMRSMNDNIHTARDVIDSNSNWAHSAMFSKVAVALALDLGNSTLREP